MKKMKMSTRLIITIGIILLLLTSVVAIEYIEIRSLESGKDRLVYAEEINKNAQAIRSWTLDYYDTDSEESAANIESSYQTTKSLVDAGLDVYKKSNNKDMINAISDDLDAYYNAFVEYNGYVTENEIYYSNMSSTANGMLARLDKAIAMQKEEYYKFISDISNSEQFGTSGLSVQMTKEYEKTITSNEAVKAIQNVIESELKYLVTGESMYDGRVYSQLNALDAICDKLYDMYDSFAVKDAVEDIKYYIKDFREKYDAYKELLSLQQAKKDEMRDIVISITEKSEALANVQEVQMENDMKFAVVFALAIGIFSIALGSILAFSITRSLNTQLTKSIRKLSDSATHVSTASTELASSSQQLSEGSTEQAASIEETSATMDETSAMVKQNTDSTKQATLLSNEANKSAADGSTMVVEMSECMDEIRASSDEISKIIKVIDDIAFQTNMLALNAAVEAARAGDAGLGFAVVAQEVRNLAQKSADAAKETAEIIDKNIDLSVRGVGISDNVSSKLGEITKNTNTVNRIIGEIYTASEEQARGTSQVTQAIDQMEKVVQINASTARESATSAEELNVQAKKLEEVVDELGKMVNGENNRSKEISKEKQKTKNKRAKRFKNFMGMSNIIFKIKLKK